MSINGLSFASARTAPQPCGHHKITFISQEYKEVFHTNLKTPRTNLLGGAISKNIFKGKNEF